MFTTMNKETSVTLLPHLFFLRNEPAFQFIQVQLSTNHDSSLPIPSAISSSSPKQKAEKLLALIENEEGKYQILLNDAYQEMAEKTFKGLRRALPLTRQKLDWDRVSDFLHLNKWLSTLNGTFDR